MKIHLLNGFLGSGKTTAIQSACKVLLAQGIRPAVVTNDQGSRLVDNDFFTSLGIAGRQVANGCFCCNYTQLEAQLNSLQEHEHPDVLFAESVGSCTDIVATVLKPLRKHRSDSCVSFSVFADTRLLDMLLNGSHQFRESVSYIYFKQLEEAPLIILNKTDLADLATIESLEAKLKDRYPDKKILRQNSLDEKNVSQWLTALDQIPAESPPSLSIDYDTYGEGEALLAWLDEEIEIRAVNSNAPACAATFIDTLQSKIFNSGLPIGHLKFLANNEVKISFVQGSSPQIPAALFSERGGRTSLLINARVQTDPDTLAAMVRQTITDIEQSMHCTITVISLSSFQPGYPTPTHRITE